MRWECPVCGLSFTTPINNKKIIYRFCLKCSKAGYNEYTLEKLALDKEEDIIILYQGGKKQRKKAINKIRIFQKQKKQSEIIKKRKKKNKR